MIMRQPSSCSRPSGRTRAGRARRTSTATQTSSRRQRRCGGIGGSRAQLQTRLRARCPLRNAKQAALELQDHRGTRRRNAWCACRARARSHSSRAATSRSASSATRDSSSAPSVARWSGAPFAPICPDSKLTVLSSASHTCMYSFVM